MNYIEKLAERMFMVDLAIKLAENMPEIKLPEVNVDVDTTGNTAGNDILKENEKIFQEEKKRIEEDKKKKKKTNVGFQFISGGGTSYYVPGTPNISADVDKALGTNKKKKP